MSMKRFFYLILFLSFFNVSFGQKSSLLWEISGKNFRNSSYIFGTIHAIPKQQFFIPDRVAECFRKCSKLVLEVKMDDPNIQSELSKVMIMKDSTIDQLLSEVDYKKADIFFKDSLGVSLRLMNKMKPLFISSLIVPKFAGKSFASFENSFMAMAKKQKIEIYGLESVQESIGQIDKISLSEQVKSVMDFVNDFEKSKREYKQLVECYLKQDVNLLYLLMIKDDSEFKLCGDALLKERNLLWLHRMINYAKESSSFIAVGCGHLGGPDGLLELLKKEGYSVKPIL